MEEVTRIIQAIERGDAKAAEELLPVVYEELRQMAALKMAQEKPGNTLQATALVHEAYLSLAGSEAAQINIWDVHTQQRVSTVQGHNQLLGYIINVSPDGGRFAAASIGVESIKLWDATSWEEVANLHGRAGFHLHWPYFLSDGNTIAVWEDNLADRTERIRLWRAPSWKEIEAVESAESVKR